METGNLRPPRYWEHNLLRNGSWNNFYVCPEKTDPAAGVKCPLCADNKVPALVALFTIIDHRQHTSKDKTKVYKDTKRLLVAKPQTFELLNKHAIKRGGLTGCTFDASRVGARAPAVGSMFDFVEKNTLADLKKLYTKETVDPKTNQKVTVTNFTPADYDKEINTLSIEDLQKLVITTGDDTPFSGKPGSGTGGSPDYSDQL